MTDYNTRKYDIVIFGATGFTGALTAEYLAEIKDKDLSWAISGRTLSKLEKTRERLVKIDPSLKDLDLLIADTSNPDSLDEVLSQTRVVITTVGPYTKYGTPLVEACLRQRTHYVDLTGEYGWTRRIIDDHHKEAQEKKVLIVPSCGFDSVPSDLGVYMVAQHMRNKHNLDLGYVKMSVTDADGGVSGGTVQSLLEVFTDPKLTRKEHMDPYLLSTRRGVDKFRWPTFKYDRDFSSKWQVMFIMAVVNERVVRRSWSIWSERGQGYGNMFSYEEYMSFLPVVASFIYHISLYTFVPFLTCMFKLFPSSTEKFKSIMPGSGFGPDEKKRSKGRFTMEFIATAETEPYDEPRRVRGIVKGFRDPGYGDTCRMICESALCIAKSLKDLPGKDGGVLTPSTAFGQVLIDRLTRNKEMIFKVEDI
ncbi:hypothetical protein A0J61_04376 [Choanephora cucurbitarum]|uniref:Saccharopine dehydrogenase NADP binding domain-containing protein n=1 Tax=Choanephora cucurbitarum TaxID=101091 RepID=A0A1C7NEP7_9FUNG|nr:hypothetical protein A0J61_04376 [Choanephora cucurbitarum]